MYERLMCPLLFADIPCFFLSSMQLLGLTSAHTSSEMHSPHIIQTLKTKTGFAPVISHHEVRPEHVGTPPRPLSNHVGHPAGSAHDPDTPPHHLRATGDFELISNRFA